MMAEIEINKTSEKLNTDDFKSNVVNYVISRIETFHETSRRNTHFIRPRYVSVRRVTRFISNKATFFEEISCTQLVKLVTF